MKRSPLADASRFSGNLRHYHRGNAQAPRSWDDWVDGPVTKHRGTKNWVKIIGVLIAGLTLLGIVTGLIVELG